MELKQHLITHEVLDIKDTAFNDNRYVNVTGDTMTGALLINTNSTTALLVERDGVKDNVLVVDTTNGGVGINKAPSLAALDITGGVFSTTQNKIDGTSDEIQLIVQGHSTQTTNLQEWQNSSGSVLVNISGNGVLGLGLGTISPIDSTKRLYYSANTNGTIVSGHYFQSSTSALGASQYAFRLFATKSVADANSYYGLEFVCRTTATSGTQNNIYGIFARSTHEGAGTATVQAAYGLFTRFDNRNTGTITAGYGIRIDTPLNDGGGSIGTAYGLRISPQTTATTNYAIYTEAGNIVFNAGGDANTDFKVQSDTEANMLFLDANGNTDGQLFFGGNTAGEVIEKGGDTYWQGEGSGLPYGSCYGNDIAWTQAGAVQNTWYEVADADMADGQLNLVTHDGNGKLTVAKAGRYLINYHMTATCSDAGKELQSGISVSGTEANDGIDHEIATNANAKESLSSTAILDLAANATVEISVRTTDTGTPNIGVEHINVTIIQVGGT